MIAALASLGGILKSRDGIILTLGFVLVAGSLVFNAGDRHGSQRAAVEQAKAIVKITEEGEKAQGSVDKQVRTLEARSKVRRVRSEKKASDAVAQIQAREPDTDPVVIWAAAIDGLRNERQASSGSAGATSSEPVGRHTNPLRDAPTAAPSGWSV